MANSININKALLLVHFNNLILGELRRNGINSWIAGGALRDYFLSKPLKSDCDIFFPNLSEFNKAKDYLISKQKIKSRRQRKAKKQRGQLMVKTGKLITHRYYKIK